MHNGPIGIFDSGIGGLSILRELRKTLPRERFIYLADRKNFPYGKKPKSAIRKFSLRNTEYLASKEIKLLVVACNTATCYAIGDIRKKFSFPVVGTVPAIKPAAEKTRTGVIAVLSTPATARSPLLKRLVRENAQNCSVLNIACPGLETIAEDGKISLKNLQQAATYLNPVRLSSADYVVLGCTHFPFLGPALKRFFGKKILLMDSGKAVARRTAGLLSSANLRTTAKLRGTTAYLTTGSPAEFSKTASRLLRRRVRAVKADF